MGLLSWIIFVIRYYE